LSQLRPTPLGDTVSACCIGRFIALHSYCVQHHCNIFSLVDLFEFSVQVLGWIFLLLGEKVKDEF
jgi:hypothetical protein